MIQPEPPVLLFPTHYLGNFILGLPWICQVLEKNPRAVVVLDSRFAELAATVLPHSTELLIYPRDKLDRRQGFFTRLRHYWQFLRQLRRYPGATLIDLEGERFTGVLSLLSGCQRRIGPVGKHAERFYTQVLTLDYYRHRFNAFAQVVADFVEGPAPSTHFDYRLGPATEKKLDSLLASINRPMIAIHPGASVSYKLWPEDYFVTLIAELETKGYDIVWVGAGELDRDIIDRVMQALPQANVLDLCNQLDFVELVALYRRCCCFIGSDSGPMHLAASTGIPVLALFGPSVEAIWAPLGDNAKVLRGSKACGDSCDAWQCDFNYHCLTSLLPEQVLAAVTEHALAKPDREPS